MKTPELTVKNLKKALSKGLSPTECSHGFKKHKQQISRFMAKYNINLKDIRKKIYDETFR